MPEWFEAYEQEDIDDRKLAREGACGADFWIKPVASGLRIIKPYHCGSCPACLDRESVDVQAKLQSIGEQSKLNVLVAKPEVVSKLVKAIRSADFARFPCSNGFDYLFSIEGPGKHILEADIDYTFLTRRRPDTRKTGRLILMKDKKELGDTIQISNIRATGQNIAVAVTMEAIKKLQDGGNAGMLIDDAQTLEVYNNALSIIVAKLLENNNALVFDNYIKVEYELPVVFEPSYVLEGGAQDEPF